MVANALEDWLTRKEPEVEKSTYYDYQKPVKYYLVPAFGIVYLSDLTRSDVKAWAACWALRAACIRSA